MIKKRFLLFILFFSLFTDYLSASHLMGGEVTWTCLANGKYVFHVKLYRDCNGVPGPPSVTLSSNGPVSTILCTLQSQTDNSPVCNSTGPHITCANPQGLAGAVEEFVYQSGQITLSGIPPASGWAFWYSDCCRNAAVVNLSAVGGFTLRAKMYPYNGQNANPCFDNSPTFYEIPRTIICTGYPFVFNHNAVDKELDSLVYEWDHPLESNTGGTVFNAPIIAFQPPYTFTSPLPGPSQNPNNVAVVLDQNTGEVSYTSFTPGTFVLVIKVTAYKCGQKVAEIFRDIQVVLSSTCLPIQPGFPNNPPVLTPPFIDPSTGLQTSYIDTVYAGQNVHFIFNGQDLDADANFVFQNLSLTASGLEFEPTYADPNGPCLHPPCATLSPSPLTYHPQINYATTFDWNTSCDQLGFNTNCRTFSNVYTFVFKFFDDFCPIPGISTATVTIVLLPPPLASPPSIRCVAVQPNGDVTLNWVPGPDPAGTFTAYDIYHSFNAAGPFNFVDSVTSYLQTSYTHLGANAGNQPAFYNIVVRSGCDDYTGSNSTDTVQAIKLSAVNSATGFAHLTWNSTLVPLIPTNGLYYYIYREYPLGTSVLIDSMDVFPGIAAYDDPITICNDTVRYRVEVADSSGCRSVSSIAFDVFQDLIPPSIPLLDSVSVDANGLAVSGWAPDSSSDTYAYVIFTSGPNGWTPIDTLYGINNVFYATNLDASTSSIPIRILAIDSCGNPCSMGPPQSTIHLTGELDVCTSSINLDWSSYINWPGVNYSIYISENGGPAVVVDTTSQTNYIHTPLTQHAVYCYFIRANDITQTLRTSTSNKICITAYVLVQPVFSYIHTATVTGNNQVTIKAYVDTAADIISYRILRSEAGTGFIPIASIPANQFNPAFSYTDYTAKTSERSYFYKVAAIDSCGQEAFTSEVARTIYLSGTANDDISNSLEWNDYEVWLGGVDHYLLYRSVDGVPEGVINNVAFGSGHVIDDVSTKIYSDGAFCYYVEAYEGPGNSFGFRDTSRSNEVCVYQKPIVFVPNAFHPGDAGFNNEFNPFKAFIKGQSFSIDIYNRWGENVFHNTDPKKGWDGTYKGNQAPTGVYVYYFKVKGADDSDIERKGTLTLIR